MHTARFRRGIVTALTTALLAAGASAQDGAQQDVNIKAKTQTSAVQATTTNQRMVKPLLVDRDPFINQLESAQLPGKPTPHKPNPHKPNSDVKNFQGDRLNQTNQTGESEAVAAVVPAPDVKVNGIVSSGKERQAIISTSAGTRLITTGQKLGDYRVAAIGTNYVSFSYGGKKIFKVPMENEFASK